MNRWTFEFIDPLGLMALAAYIGENGYEPGVFTGAVADAAKLMEDWDPDRPVAAVGLYCDYENQSVVESFSRHIKQTWGLPVVVGGPQAVALGKEFLESSQCDAIARGEGELTLFELLECLVRGRGHMAGINGISYLDQEGRLAIAPERELIPELDSLPMQKPSYSLTEAKNNISIMTGRGCPFSCAFCHQGGQGGKVRFRSVQSVTSEIKQLLEQYPKVKYLWFADDTFTLNEKRVEGICRELAELRRHRDFIWFCEGHPSTIVKWPHMVERMVEAGLARMQIGIESGSPRIINTYNKHTTLEQIEEVVRICRRANLAQLCGNIIIGGAHESQQSLEDTWQFVDKLISLAPGMLDISFTLFMPYPCTAITDSPSEYGIKLADPTALTSVGDYPVVETQSLGTIDIARARRDIVNKLFKRMARLLAQGLVSHEDILRQYRLCEDYDISSIWLSGVYAQEPFLHRRYTLLTKTSASTIKDIPAGDLMGWRPLRVMNLWNALTWRDGAPSLGRMVLSPFEYQLIIQCSGKMTLDRVLDNISGMYADRFDSQQEARKTAMGCLEEFEKRNWLVFMPY